tara:strand:+ start:43 stop:921 length:879 start_codon:yes stop_codon:yes gene_type:complete
MQLDLFNHVNIWNSRTGYKMANRAVGYRGKKFDEVCFQHQLRKSLDDDRPRSNINNSVVYQIPFKMAQNFILKYEWLGTMGTTKISFGMFCEDELVGVMCFGMTAGTGALSEVFGEEKKHLGLVLVRGACASHAHQHSGSWMIGQAKKELAKRGYNFVIAYSDPEAGEIGTLYQATNWNFYGFTSPVNYLVRPDGKRVDPKIIHKYANKRGLTSQEQKQDFIDNGYTFEKGSRKLKYFLTFGDKKKLKDLVKCQVVNTYSYLKREIPMNVLYEEWKKQINYLKQGRTCNVIM